MLGADFAGNWLLDGLVDVGEDVKRHQVGDQLERLALHLFGEIADDDRRLHGDQRTIGRRRVLGLGWAGRGWSCCRLGGWGGSCFGLLLRSLLAFALTNSRANRHVSQLDEAHFFAQFVWSLLFFRFFGFDCLFPDCLFPGGVLLRFRFNFSFLGGVRFRFLGDFFFRLLDGCGDDDRLDGNRDGLGLGFLGASDFFLEVLGGDFVECTRGNLRVGDPQLLGLG